MLFQGRTDEWTCRTLCKSYTRAGSKRYWSRAGPRISTELLRLRLVDELVLFIAPKIIGTGIDAIGDLGVTPCRRLWSSLLVRRLLDGDIMFRGKPIWPETVVIAANY